MQDFPEEAGARGVRVDLRGQPLLQGLKTASADELDRAAQVLCLHKTESGAGGVIAAGDLFVVLSGVVSLESPVPGRDSVLIDILEPGSVLWNLMETGDAPLRLRAETLAVVARVAGDTVRALVGRDTVLALRLLDVVSRHSRRLLDNVLVTRDRSAAARIASYLNDRIEAREEPQPVVTLPVCKQRIARLLGLTAPSFSRALRKLADDGLLFGSGRKVRILDRPRLATLAAR